MITASCLKRQTDKYRDYHLYPAHRAGYHSDKLTTVPSPKLAQGQRQLLRIRTPKLSSEFEEVED
jgi:hypothetical protein